MGGEWIVVVGGPPAWGGCGSQALSMAEAFWRLGRKVLYVECGGSRKSFRRVLGQGSRAGQNVVADLERNGFFVMRASQFPGFQASRPEFARYWASHRTSARVERFLTASKAESVIACHYDWYFHDLFAGARETVSHVYECTDDHRNAPEVSGHARRRVARGERKLLAKAKAVVFSSPELAAERDPETETGVIIPMGVDAARFAGRDVPDPHDRLGIPERRAGEHRVGFLGRLTERSDWAMVRAAAAETPRWQWIVAGPADGIKPRGPANLHWVGAVRPDELPAWLTHWDVGIVPYTPETDFNRRKWPMKLLEYLAAGLPVVSTDIPAAREVAARLPGLVRVCREHSSKCFVESVRQALATPAWQREAGRSFAAQFTWEDRARRLLDIVEGARASQSGRPVAPAEGRPAR